MLASIGSISSYRFRKFSHTTKEILHSMTNLSVFDFRKLNCSEILGNVKSCSFIHIMHSILTVM